jgi:hypothetical protein
MGETDRSPEQTRENQQVERALDAGDHAGGDTCVSSVVAVSGERLRNAANRLQL